MPQFLLHPSDLDAVSGTAVLRGEEARHLVRVHRVRVGEAVKLFDGGGRRWRARFAGGDPAEARLEEAESLPPNEPPLRLELIQALAKGERWDWILEKGTELGVRRFLPVHAERSVPRIEAARLETKLSRWQKQVLAACKQCERAVLPEVEAPSPLPALLGGLPSPREDEIRIYLAERHPAAIPRPGRASPARVRIAVGPEGGWEEGERRALEAAHFQPVTLGPRILRVETACVAGIALILARWGDLEGFRTPW